MENFTDYNLKSGNILRVIQDDSAESPNTWGNEDQFLVYDHRQFNVKREGFKPENIYYHLQAKSALEKFLKENNNSTSEDYEEKLEELNYYIDNSFDNYFIFPVYAYIHSGVSLSLGKDSYPFNDRWDVSATGFLLVDKNDTDFNYSRNNCIEYKDKTDEELAFIFGEGLIETWNQYLSGDVYGFKVLEPVKSYSITEKELNSLEDKHINSFLKVATEEVEYEELDSCWGFYGSNPKENGMIDHIDEEIV